MLTSPPRVTFMISKEIEIYEGLPPDFNSELPEEVLTRLVQRAQRQDEAAFDTLYRFYYPQIRGYLAHLTVLTSSTDLMEDFIQETFIKAWVSLPGLIDKPKIKNWLFRIARNVFLDHMRKIGQQPRLVAIEATSAQIVSTGIAFEDAIETMELIKLALELVH